MDALGLSQLAAARAAGLGPDYVRDILRGRIKEPGGLKLSQLAAALNCSVEYLLGLVSEVGSPPVESESERYGRKPLIYRLSAGVYRDTDGDSADIPGAYAVVVGNPEHRNRQTWLAYVDDDHAEPIIPRGYVVEVLEFNKEIDAGLLREGLAVVEVYRDGGALAERTIKHAAMYTKGRIGLAGVCGRGPAIIIRDRDEARPRAKVLGWILTAFTRFDGWLWSGIPGIDVKHASRAYMPNDPG